MSDVMSKVRAAVGGKLSPATPPAPPQIDDGVARLVQAGGDLTDHFARLCEENKMHVQRATAADLAGQVAAFLKSAQVRRVAIAAGGVLERLNIAAALRSAGLEVATWDQMTLDELYDFDCGITDVDYAVAETGSLVVRASVQRGRALSLVPRIHVAIVQASQIVPDLIDLFRKLGEDGTGSAVSLITGPSKTSDIEMNLVVGVHGPMKVQVFLVE